MLKRKTALFIGSARGLGLALGLATSVAHAADLPPFSADILAWPRLSAAEMGCLIEKRFGHRDARFNCDLKDYVKPRGCDEPDRYYEGPQFPEALAARVHPLASEVNLSFEHGDLQMVIVRLAGSFSEPQFLEALGIADADARPGNVMYLSVGPHSVMLQGFDHMGGADVDCGPRSKSP
jgi:hypothetical protein